MKIRPGRTLIALACVLAVFSVIGILRPLAVLAIPVAVVVACLLVAIDLDKLRSALRVLDVRRTLPNPVARGQPFACTLVVQNNHADSWTGEVRGEVPPAAQPDYWAEEVLLPERRAAAIAYPFTIAVRGKYTFGPIWVRLRSRLGLLEAQRSYGEPESIQVYPESLLSPHELAKDAADEVRLLDQLRDTRYQGTGTEFESLEEYRHGDDPRHIDWRTTARFGRLVVRRFQVERHRDVVVLVDCGRLMAADAGRGTKLDCAVDASLRLLRIALRGGDRCGLGIFDDQVRGFLRPISGSKALPTFLASLYDVQSRLRETDFSAMFATLQSRLTKRALVIVISDVNDAETTTRYRQSLITLAQRHVVLFAALRTPLLGQLVAAPLASMDDAFKKVVTFRILREREQALHALRRSGVHILDVEPSQLTAPLINQFIGLRRSSVL